MSCTQTKLFCVSSGYNYVFNANTKKNLTGSTIHFVVKTPNESDAVFDLTNTTDDSISGVYINDIAKGDFDIRIIGIDSANVLGNKVYECYYENSKGKELLFQGKILFDGGAIQ